MNRRALLRIAAGVLGGGAATAAGLSVATGGAAQTGLTLSVDGDSASIGTDGAVSAATGRSRLAPSNQRTTLFFRGVAE